MIWKSCFYLRLKWIWSDGQHQQLSAKCRKWEELSIAASDNNHSLVLFQPLVILPVLVMSSGGFFFRNDLTGWKSELNHPPAAWNTLTHKHALSISTVSKIRSQRENHNQCSQALLFFRSKDLVMRWSFTSSLQTFYWSWSRKEKNHLHCQHFL